MRMRAAMKYTALAYAHLARGQAKLAIAAADTALKNSNAPPIRYLTARILVEAGAVDRARPMAAAFTSQLTAEQQAYGKILEGGIALKAGDAQQAIKLFTEANETHDTWLGHFDLGRALFAARRFPKPTQTSIAVFSVVVRR